MYDEGVSYLDLRATLVGFFASFDLILEGASFVCDR